MRFSLFTAAVGGLLGLGFGFSFISAMEMCYFVCKRMLMVACKREEHAQPLFIRTVSQETSTPLSLIIAPANLHSINQQYRVPVRSNNFRSFH